MEIFKGNLLMRHSSVPIRSLFLFLDSSHKKKRKEKKEKIRRVQNFPGIFSFICNPCLFLSFSLSLSLSLSLIHTSLSSLSPSIVAFLCRILELLSHSLGFGPIRSMPWFCLQCRGGAIFSTSCPHTPYLKPDISYPLFSL